MLSFPHFLREQLAWENVAAITLIADEIPTHQSFQQQEQQPAITPPRLSSNEFAVQEGRRRPVQERNAARLQPYSAQSAQTRESPHIPLKGLVVRIRSYAYILLTNFAERYRTMSIQTQNRSESHDAR